MPTIIASFGVKYGDPPQDGKVIDVRPHFRRNPFRDKRLRRLRGTDLEVQLDIQRTPDFKASYERLLVTVRACPEDIVYLGCTGGHHRSVYLAELIAKALGAMVYHRDIGKR
jgi:RNase adapter protein RapZ